MWEKRPEPTEGARPSESPATVVSHMRLVLLYVLALAQKLASRGPRRPAKAREPLRNPPGLNPCSNCSVNIADTRYLDENATPEWKRAYIDYRGAKKAIKRAVASRENQAVDENNDFSSEDEDNGPSAKPRAPGSPGGSALSRIISGSSPRSPNTARSGKTPRTPRTPKTPRPGTSPLSPRPASATGRSGLPTRSPAPGGTRVSTGLGVDIAICCRADARARRALSIHADVHDLAQIGDRRIARLAPCIHR